LGRYITSDPVGLDGGNNTYLYAGANTVAYIDLYGLTTIVGPRPVIIPGAYPRPRPFPLDPFPPIPVPNEGEKPKKCERTAIQTDK
jgi:uncharacterized protein RhaS with RHS repeats